MDAARDTTRDTAAVPPVGDHAGRADSVYLDLKRRLLIGDFPLRTRLGEQRLAATLGVSRTPVRQALHRLHAERLLERHPEGGLAPAALDLVGLRELYEVRRMFELAALVRPDQQGTTHDAGILEPLRDEWLELRDDQPVADPGFVLCDERFHEQLALAAGNRALVGLLHDVNERIRLIRMHDFLTEERIATTISQHLGIVEAVLAGDLVRGRELFESHIGESIAVVESRATRALARMATEGRALWT
jgi:DNA-binding GntR family transcriptional regulator